MTKRISIHVGAPKSGTTYLQTVLRENRTRLGEAGILVVGDRHADLVHAGLAIREDPRVKTLPGYAADAWPRLITQIKEWPGDNAVLSYELLAGASADQVHTVLAELSGIEVHVVITARDFAKAVPSAWQERLKFAQTIPLESWKPTGEEAGPRAEWSWRTLDPAGVAARWGAELPPERVHIVTVPGAPSQPDELWNRFSAACGIDVAALDVRVVTANESLGPVTAELLRRVNTLVRPPIEGNREHARWLRDTLAHQVLVPLGTRGLGLTDEQFADAAARADAAIAAIEAAGYDVCGSLEDLRATRPSAGLPGEATDADLLQTACQAIVELLLLLRSRTRDEPAPTPSPAAGSETSAAAPEPLGDRGKSLARRTLGRVGSPFVARDLVAMRERMRLLEEQIQRDRALHRRVAELDDLVTELLLPAAELDDAALHAAIERYRTDSL